MQTLLTHIQQHASPNELEAVQTNLLLYLLQNYSNQRSPSVFTSAKQAVKKARDFIHQNYPEDFSLQDIAQYSHLSPYHLIRQFKKQFGLSPFQYLRNYRIEKAKELLKRASSITEAALEVGFFDHSHFLKNFKKTEGISPSKMKSGIKSTF
jgi:AraC-like DNA-binding protein